MWYAVRPCDALLLVLSVEVCDDVDNDECQMSVVIQSRWPENKYYVLCVDDGMMEMRCEPFLFFIIIETQNVYIHVGFGVKHKIFFAINWIWAYSLTNLRSFCL